ncbi:riboflavin deaminase [Rhodobacter sp. TJ_12]|uniref:dihydrofolate reductase family protein n=1 Tax=Rhodobacter sp. TJ_12 TaxID=2029399 RepID=UPI001CBC5041|nr:dihydrofolate reductase family protein [Rhodobacter sp. TJ_12]MBZ4021296.1 riboflavin deaminase [Rhodobacter sp. TJ_12]
MSRPEIICHMLTTLDGRLKPERWPYTVEALLAVYDPIAAKLEAEGWIAGRRTMEHYLPHGDPQVQAAPQSRADHIADHAGRRLGIAFDRSGRLRPESGDLDGEHLVLVVSDRVRQAHVDDLAARGVSVIFSGPDGEDIAGALTRIGTAFGVTRLLLEGGGEINGAFLAAGVIEETSTLLYPIIDGLAGEAAIYDHRGPLPAQALELLSVETLPDGVVWLRHRVKRG